MGKAERYHVADLFFFRWGWFYTEEVTVISELQGGLLIILIEVEAAPVPRAITFGAAHLEPVFSLKICFLTISEPVTQSNLHPIPSLENPLFHFTYASHQKISEAPGLPWPSNS